MSQSTESQVTFWNSHQVHALHGEVATADKSRASHGIQAQIGHEFGASMQYLSIAAHFQERQLILLAKLFTKQADEEKEHAMKFVRYIMDTKGGLAIPQIPAPKPTFSSAEKAVQAALDWEQEVTRQITNLMGPSAVGQNDAAVTAEA